MAPPLQSSSSPELPGQKLKRKKSLSEKLAPSNISKNLRKSVEKLNSSLTRSFSTSGTTAPRLKDSQEVKKEESLKVAEQKVPTTPIVAAPMYDASVTPEKKEDTPDVKEVQTTDIKNVETADVKAEPEAASPKAEAVLETPQSPEVIKAVEEASPVKADVNDITVDDEVLISTPPAEEAKAVAVQEPEEVVEPTIEVVAREEAPAAQLASESLPSDEPSEQEPVVAEVVTEAEPSQELAQLSSANPLLRKGVLVLGGAILVGAVGGILGPLIKSATAPPPPPPPEPKKTGWF